MPDYRSFLAWAGVLPLGVLLFVQLPLVVLGVAIAVGIDVITQPATS